MIIIINGAPGSGKTKTAQALMESTPQSAIIDGDSLLGVNPRNNTEDEMLLRYKNIASLARNFYEAGYHIVFIAFVYMAPHALAKQLDMLEPIDAVTVFALIPSEDVLRNRHREDSYVREAIESSIDINSKIAAIESIHKIDNSEMSIDAVASQIKQVVGLQ